jgi:hypothetical protein
VLNKCCFINIVGYFSAKAETDKATSEAEMKELERQISHDRKLRDFMKLKSQERQEDEELVTYRKRRGFISLIFLIFIKGNLFLELEAAEKRRKEKEEHSVEAYESKFKQIQAISHEQDLEKLVDKFIEGLIFDFFFYFKSKNKISI